MNRVKSKHYNILKLQINPRKNKINMTNNNYNKIRCFNYFDHPPVWIIY